MEEILRQILDRLTGLEKGQDELRKEQQSQGLRLQRMEKELKAVKKDTEEIKNELKYVWDDIKRISNRLESHEQELEMIKGVT
ncbi:MAG: hypothetical protein QME76_11100 [Bacillota bacterium]|nr:hypothetical protein [Bacillota bacterium]